MSKFQFTTIDRAALKALRPEIEKALTPLAEKLGISLKVGRGTYAGANGMLKLEIAVKSSDGVVRSKEAEAFKVYAPSDGVPADSLGKEFNAQGESYRLVGYKSRATKRPFLVERVKDGRPFVMPASMVRRGLGV